MRTQLIRIGNSQGVRIPKSVIEQCGLSGEVDMTVSGNTVVIAPARRLREGWAADFAATADARDGAPLLPGNLSSGWDDAEWTW